MQTTAFQRRKQTNKKALKVSSSPMLRPQESAAIREYQPENLLTNDLIRQLLSKLNREGIRYCHWKSNWKIENWLIGEGDLDLLVERRDINKFLAVLSLLDFKKTLSPPAKELPGIVNYYGWDEQSGKLIHLHVHYQLVMGHDSTKNYRLPVESAMLENAVRQGEIFTASPEFELILFVIRMVLKYSAAESVARRLLGKQQQHSKEIIRELYFLEEQIDLAKFSAILEEYFPAVNEKLFAECCDSLRSAAGVGQRIKTRRKLEKCLVSYARNSPLNEAFLRFGHRLKTVGQKLFGWKNERRRFENGGTLIAVIGGDGSGKSTCVKAVHQWLSKKFAARAVHLGRPPKSALTVLSGGLLRAQRFFKKIFVFGKKAEFDRFAPEDSFLQKIRWLCTARDRYRLYRKIRRLSSNGEIIICDRFPVKNLELMDGPRILQLNRKTGGKLTQKLIEREQWYYRQIYEPDVLIVLRVEPETAVRRKTDEPAEHVRPRAAELWRLNWQQTSAELIDSNQELPEVLADLRKLVWAAI